MKCLILAAGKGSRLSQKGSSKPLIRLLGIPLIERTIRSASEAGIDEFFVVSGYHGEQLRRYLDGLAGRCSLKITHVITQQWEQGNGLSVLAAKDQLDEPFVLLMADHLFEPSILRDLAARAPNDGEISLAVDHDTANPLVDLEDVTRVRSENGQLIEIGKGLETFNGFDTGVFFCTPAIFDAVQKSIAERADSSLSGAVRSLAAEGHVNDFDVGGRFWCDTDTPRDLQNAENALLDRLRGKSRDGPVSRYLNRPLSVRISRQLARVAITPNQISVVSFLLCLVAAWLFSLPRYMTLALGGLIAQFASIIDGCDGEIARLKFLKSDFGGWFDAVLDRYADAMLVFGLTWHAHTAGPLHDVLVSLIGDRAGAVVLIVGFLALTGSFMNSYTADKYDKLMEAKFSQGRSIRLGRDVRVLLIAVGAVCNLALAPLIVLAILMNLETVRRVVVCYRHEKH